MDIGFDCTQCGKCCHDLKLPLSVAEAMSWLERGHEVQILCEAIPWPSEPRSNDSQAAYKRSRSFEVLSGSMPSRVVVTLVASFNGACPHLGKDMRCGIYESRPRVCRIYPAEINPFVSMMPTAKACPPEAWGTDRSPLLRHGSIVDAGIKSLITESRDASERDVAAKERLCEILHIRDASLANEGFVIHSPGNDELKFALSTVGRIDMPEESQGAGWRFISNREATLSALADIGALATDPAQAAVEYRDFAAV